MLKLTKSPQVIVLTGNANKFAEISKILQRYGIQAVQNPNTEPDDAAISLLFEQNDKAVSVFRETSCLIDRVDATLIENPFDKINALREVMNFGKLTSWNKCEDGSVVEKSYVEYIDGYIDLTNADENSDVFEWDGIFKVSATGLSYQEAKERGLKNSVRDILVGGWIVINLHYDVPQSYAHLDYKQSSTIDFDKSVVDFVRQNPYMQKFDVDNGDGIWNCLRGVLNDGVFFRAPINRRQKNYWLPGQNAGIPQTPKKDSLHETTFSLHDIFHHAQPLLDLVFTGSQLCNTTVAKNIYCIHRMCGEAFSLVMADMIFIDQLVSTGVEYDYEKRHIYPLYKAIKLYDQGDFASTIQPLLRANVVYAITGDDSGFRSLKNPSVSDEEFEAALQSYTGKYESYFRVDWQWTVANYNCMSEKSHYFADWYSQLGEDLVQRANLTTLDHFVECLLGRGNDLESLSGTVNAIFEKVFIGLYKLINQNNILDAPENIKSNAFRRYMIGQSMLFSVWDFMPRMKSVGKAILSELQVDHFTDEDIQRIRTLYNTQLDFLRNQGVISSDDLLTWQGIYPLFEPSYVYYDRKGEQKTLAQVAQLCFSNLYPIKSIVDTVDKVPFLDQEKLWDNLAAIPLEKRLSAIVACSGGQFFDPEQTLILQPGMAIINVGGMPCANVDLPSLRSSLKTSMGGAAAWTYLNPNNWKLSTLFNRVTHAEEFSIAHTVSITVLVAGVSALIENEFNSQRDLVHLARLTEARTKAQSNPPSVVLDINMAGVVHKMRANAKELADEAFDLLMLNTNLPLKDRLEMANSLFPGHKASVFAMTGSLRSFQKLVTGLNDNGKEEEYRRVLYKLNNILHNLMPELFESSSSYGFTIRA